MDITVMNKYTGFTVNKIGGVNAFLNGIETTLTSEEAKKVVDSGIEIAPYVNPVKTLDNIRAERDALLTKNVDIYNPLRWAELSADQKAKVKAYRQALLDITKQDPSSVIWSELPAI